MEFVKVKYIDSGYRGTLPLINGKSLVCPVCGDKSLNEYEEFCPVQGKVGEVYIITGHYDSCCECGTWFGTEDLKTMDLDRNWEELRWAWIESRPITQTVIDNLKDINITIDPQQWKYEHEKYVTYKVVTKPYNSMVLVRQMYNGWPICPVCGEIKLEELPPAYFPDEAEENLNWEVPQYCFDEEDEKGPVYPLPLASPQNWTCECCLTKFDYHKFKPSWTTLRERWIKKIGGVTPQIASRLRFAGVASHTFLKFLVDEKPKNQN